MRESRTYGSVRGAQGDLRPYRDRIAVAIQNQLVSSITFRNAFEPQFPPRSLDLISLHNCKPQASYRSSSTISG
jgi:hypothetical protein